MDSDLDVDELEAMDRAEREYSSRQVRGEGSWMSRSGEFVRGGQRWRLRAKLLL